MIIGAITSTNVIAERSIYSEDYYNRIWCNQKGGIAEYVIQDRKRVDCLMNKYAVEADWATYKSYEAIGQSLHYAKVTNKYPGVLLIIKDSKGLLWVKLVKEVFKEYNIKSKVWYIIAEERFE